ncbi:MAG: hypothetical protein BZY81_05065 [SAR202 cluster bacterium Io17-Chloro-G4]|nr:MAG: hypothetical protein BZY81_05065 [SAR202 cluster bacterium Io17-Chloro-G4]
MLTFPELKKLILADAGNGTVKLAIDRGIQKAGVLSQGLEELDRIDDAVTRLGEALEDLQEALDDLRETFGGASQ